MKSSLLLALATALPVSFLPAEQPGGGNSGDVSVRHPFEWRELPALPDAVGFAGPYAGVHNDALIAGGGANFAEGLPWEGGSAVMRPGLRAELIVEDLFPGGEEGYELGRGNVSRLIPLLRGPEGERIRAIGQIPAATTGFSGAWLHHSSSNMFLTVPENLSFLGIGNPAGTGSLSTTATGGGALVRNASRGIGDFEGVETLWFAVVMQANERALKMAEPGVTTNLIAFLSQAPANFTNWNQAENNSLAGVGFGLFGGKAVLRFQSEATGGGRVENAFFPADLKANKPYLFLARLQVNPDDQDDLDAWLLSELPTGGESLLGTPHVRVTTNILADSTDITHLSAIIATPTAVPPPGNSVNFDAIRMATSYDTVTATDPFRLRTITYNVYRYHGWPRTEENRERRLAASDQIAARIAQELLLYQPDVVTLQEGDSEEVVARIADLMEMNYAFFPSRPPRTTPGAVLSRYRIVESDNRPLRSPEKDADDLFTRHWGRAVLQTPAGKISVHSAHLQAWRTEQAIRLRELPLILETIQSDIENGLPVILQGDLNFRPDATEHMVLQEAGLVDVFLARGEGVSYTIPSDQPTGRIDYVFLGGAFKEASHYSRVLFEGAFRTNPNDPQSFALSDHLPVLADIIYRRTAF